MIANPNEIENFVEIYKTLHITKAAIRLGITQPSLTQSLQKLEEKVGSKLFIRTKQGVVATAAGKLFFTKSLRLLENWREVQDGIRQSDTELSGRFRVGAHASVATYTLPLFFKNLNDQAPKIEIDLIHDFSRKINEGIISYEIDLGYVVNPVRHPDLVLKKIGNDYVRFWKKKGLSKVPQKIFADSSLNQIETLLGKTYATHFSDWTLVQSSSLELIRTLVADGHGIGILPERIAKLEGFDLVPVDKALPVYADEIYLAYRKEALSSRAGKELIRLASISLA